MKRIFDLTLLFISLPLIFLTLALVILLVKIKLGSPVFFIQKRTGINGIFFNIYKFRTMTNEFDDDGFNLPDEKRLTKFGKMLRTSSLDELPELWNILKGDMSLVGPRPLLEEYLPLYSPTQAKRHNVKPGITGWAQVNGRNAISWEKKFEFDVWYVENQSIWLDIKILFLTLMKISTGDGVTPKESPIMPVFKGSKK